MSADGQRFFAILDEPVAPSPPVTQLNVVLNWVEELKEKVPVRQGEAVRRERAREAAGDA